MRTEWAGVFLRRGGGAGYLRRGGGGISEEVVGGAGLRLWGVRATSGRTPKGSYSPRGDLKPHVWQSSSWAEGSLTLFCPPLKLKGGGRKMGDPKAAFQMSICTRLSQQGSRYQRLQKLRSNKELQSRKAAACVDEDPHWCEAVSVEMRSVVAMEE